MTISIRLRVDLRSLIWTKPSRNGKVSGSLIYRQDCRTDSMMASIKQGLFTHPIWIRSSHVPGCLESKSSLFQEIAWRERRTICGLLSWIKTTFTLRLVWARLELSNLTKTFRNLKPNPKIRFLINQTHYLANLSLVMARKFSHLLNDNSYY